MRFIVPRFSGLGTSPAAAEARTSTGLRAGAAARAWTRADCFMVKAILLWLSWDGEWGSI
jgi:hypothetical protein